MEKKVKSPKVSKSSWFNTKGKECRKWAKKMRGDKKEDTAVFWYLRSYFAFMRGEYVEKAKKVMQQAIEVHPEQSFSLAQCYFQLALAKVKMRKNPSYEVKRGQEILNDCIKNSIFTNPFMPHHKKYEGILSAFKILLMIWNGKFEKAKERWRNAHRKILISWNWYRDEIDILMNDLLHKKTVKEAIKAFNRRESTSW